MEGVGRGRRGYLGVGAGPRVDFATLNTEALCILCVVVVFNRKFSEMSFVDKTRIAIWGWVSIKSIPPGNK